ncbi:MAG: RagB/SusD family nutrient uptake outer membrane protein [Imperialibacter sp.]|uniref:RagB/SusD family nutrient uptake outer membrane protein n=1 Tax=Imperialibacter sp. TaxID=2038411 RepID=UPI0032EF1248
MKNIISIVTFVSLFMMSCNKDFIDIAPVDTVSIDALFKTDKDYNDAVIGIYGSLQDQYQDMWLFGDMRGDDSWDELVKNTAAAMDNFTINNDDNVLRDTWRNYYVTISRCNMLLARIEKADPTVVKNKDLYTGEAKFIRALAYFDMVRIFGDVQLITTPITIEESYTKGRESVEKIYNEVIIPDLLDAETKLPGSYSGSDVGRATMGAAKSILGKVYMTRHEFVKAEAKLKEVTMMGYALLENYNDLFDYMQDEHHSEYIFDIEYEEGLGGEGNCFTTNFTPKNPELAEFYGVTGGQNGNNNAPPHLFEIFEPGDVRKDVTAANGHTDADGNFIPLIPTSNDVATFTKKYMVRLLTSCDSRANWKVIRYADVLLLYAEALNENGKTVEALGFLNQVRNRGGLDDLTGLSQAETRDRIYTERRFELSFEGHRWFDLVRTGRALEVMAPLGMKDYMTVFPIPLAQIQLMNDLEIFPQNSGYN